jgi:hypothetical protein
LRQCPLDLQGIRIADVLLSNQILDLLHTQTLLV